jgi:hypothetical protein
MDIADRFQEAEQDVEGNGIGVECDYQRGRKCNLSQEESLVFVVLVP